MYSIEVFPWNKNFEVGVPLIDEQHKRLVELLNALAGHLTYQSDMPTLSHVFNELVQYTVYHFSTEEGIWHELFMKLNLRINVPDAALVNPSVQMKLFFRLMMHM